MANDTNTALFREDIRTMPQPTWRIAFFGAFALLLYVFWPTVLTLHERWVQWSQTFSHGYLLLAVASYLIWRARDDLGGRWRHTAWWALPFLLGASFFWFAGFATQLTIAQQVALPAILWLWAVVALGWAAGWKLLLPTAILYFGIPLWDVLVEPLQALTVAVCESLLRWLGVPAYVTGFYIELPSGMFEVAGGCSGLNYLLVGLVIGVLHAYLNIERWRHRIAAVALVAALALLSNWIRVFALVLIGYHTEMQSDLIADHDGFGWLVFAGSLVVFFLLSRWLFEAPAAAQPAAERSASPMSWSAAAGRAWIASLLVVALPLAAQWYDGRLKATPQAGLAPFGLPQQRDQPDWLPDYKGFDTQQVWQGYVAGRSAEVVAMTWHTQERDRKLIYYSNRLAEEGDLIATPAPLRGKAFDLNRSVIRDGASRRLVWWFYLIGDQTATGSLESKIKQLPAWLTGNPRAALVTLSVRCGSKGCERELNDPILANAIEQQVTAALAAWRSDPA